MKGFMKFLWWALRLVLILTLGMQLVAPSIIKSAKPLESNEKCDAGMHVLLWTELALSLALTSMTTANLVAGLTDNDLPDWQRRTIISIDLLHCLEALFCIMAFVFALSDTVICAEEQLHWVDRDFAVMACCVLYCGVLCSVVLFPFTLDTRIKGLATFQQTVHTDPDSSVAGATRLMRKMYVVEFTSRLLVLHCVALAWYIVDSTRDTRSACMASWSGCVDSNAKCHASGDKLQLFLLGDVAWLVLLYLAVIYYSARALLSPVIALGTATKIFFWIELLQVGWGLWGSWYVYKDGKGNMWETAPNSCVAESPRLFWMGWTGMMFFFSWRSFCMFAGCSWVPTYRLKIAKAADGQRKWLQASAVLDAEEGGGGGPSQQLQQDQKNAYFAQPLAKQLDDHPSGRVWEQSLGMGAMNRGTQNFVVGAATSDDPGGLQFAGGASAELERQHKAELRQKEEDFALREAGLQRQLDDGRQQRADELRSQQREDAAELSGFRAERRLHAESHHRLHADEQHWRGLAHAGDGERLRKKELEFEKRERKMHAMMRENERKQQQLAADLLEAREASIQLTKREKLMVETQVREVEAAKWEVEQLQQQLALERQEKHSALTTVGELTKALKNAAAWKKQSEAEKAAELEALFAQVEAEKRHHEELQTLLDVAAAAKAQHMTNAQRDSELAARMEQLRARLADEEAKNREMRVKMESDKGKKGQGERLFNMYQSVYKQLEEERDAHEVLKKQRGL